LEKICEINKQNTHKHIQNRRARLDDTPTDRPDDSVSHKGKKNILHQITYESYRGRKKMIVLLPITHSHSVVSNQHVYLSNSLLENVIYMVLISGLILP